MHTAQPSFALSGLIYLVVIALFIFRNIRPQRMSVVRLWIMPIVLLGITGFSLYASSYASVLQGELPPPVWQMVIVLVLGAALGVPLGLLRGRHSEVKPTERPGVMYVHSSPVVIGIWLGAFVVRLGLRTLLPHAPGFTALGGDALLAFAMGALITSYYAIYQKYRTAVLQHAPAV